MPQISLANGGVALVDDADFELVNAHRWRQNKGYAVGRPFGGTIACAMHRFLMRPPLGMVVDHVSHDGLDNRRSNLRVCTVSQNTAHRRRSVSRAASGFFGVRTHRSGRWLVFVAHKYFGMYSDVIEAAQAYDRLALERWGEFATLNFPPDTKQEAPPAMARAS